LAFLAFGASASASPLRCGDVITQDTRLESDLTNCAGDGVVIGADGVTLDLNGHSIAGRAAGTGVLATGRRGVEVTNGAIRGFPTAIGLSGVDGAAVHEISARGMISCVTSAGCMIDHTTVQGGGIFVIRARGGSPSIVRRNLVSGAAGAGITVNYTGPETSVVRNIVEGNAGGILAFHSSVGQISDNTVSRNSGAGISAARGGDTTIQRNLLTGNGGDGIKLDHLDDVRVFGNLVAKSGGNGINGFTLSRPLLRDNVVSRSRRSGIFLDGIAPDHESTSFAVLSGNVALQNRIDGIALTAAARDSSLEGNRSRRNRDDGFDVRAASTTMTENSAQANGDLGIEAVPGVANGGENGARRNGDRAQCRNVRCH
jgi:parallel beta-helix repeat protein